MRVDFKARHSAYMERELPDVEGRGKLSRCSQQIGELLCTLHDARSKRCFRRLPGLGFPGGEGQARHSRPGKRNADRRRPARQRGRERPSASRRWKKSRHRRTVPGSQGTTPMFLGIANALVGNSRAKERPTRVGRQRLHAIRPPEKLHPGTMRVGATGSTQKSGKLQIAESPNLFSRSGKKSFAVTNCKSICVSPFPHASSSPFWPHAE
jgi:hypothetical protein